MILVMLIADCQPVRLCCCPGADDRPVIERPDGTWRALQQGLPVQPSVVRLRACSDLHHSTADDTGISVHHSCIQGLHTARHGFAQAASS